MKKILCVGSGGHFRPILDSIFLTKQNIIGVIDVNFKIKEEISGIKVLKSIDSIKNFDKKNTFLFISIGDNKLRNKEYKFYKKKKFYFTNIIHPSAILSSDISLGENIFINAGSIINSKVIIENNCIINTGSIIEHETYIGNSSHIGPGTIVAGRCKIGKSVFLGIGSKVINNISIGDNTILGAGSVLTKDAKSKRTYVGVPAKILNK